LVDQNSALRAACVKLLYEKMIADAEVNAIRQAYKEEQSIKNKVKADFEKSEKARLKLQKLCQEYKADISDTVLADKSPDNSNEAAIEITENIKEIRADRERLLQKVKLADECYSLREKHFALELKGVILQNLHLEAKLQQSAEKQLALLVQLQGYKKRSRGLMESKTELCQQLSLYAERFEQFQETFTKSNEIFASFKLEIERMTRTIKKLEKERLSLQKKCEQTDVALIDMAEERNAHRKEIDTLKKQNIRLEQLCRVLQSERKKMQTPSNRQEGDNTMSDQGLVIGDGGIDASSS